MAGTFNPRHNSSLPHPGRHRPSGPPDAARRCAGFTLVEVLVALAVLAVMATMAWQGLDGIGRAQTASQQQLERTVRLNAVLGQWEQDLATLQDARSVPALLLQGTTLRLTRRADDGLRVVAWSLRDGSWWRWAGPVVKTAGDLQESWFASQQLIGTEPQQVRMLEGTSAWQLYYFRGNAWSNAQSSARPVEEGEGAAALAALRQQVPQGVRLVLTVGADPSGPTLTRDIALAPQQP
jgi:general secretion pathway protein J